MSIVTLFTTKSPTIAGLEFDAVLEDTYESSVEFTQYSIESGANAVDHGIIQPIRWSLTGAISNNELRISSTDLLVGGASNLFGGVGSAVAGLSAGFLAGSSDTRSSSAFEALRNLQISRQPFTIDAGDVTLTNMVIATLRRTKTAENEGGLIFEAELQELPTLDTVTAQNQQPNQAQLPDDDPAQTQATSLIEKGEQALQVAGDTINSAVAGVIS
ncbi:MAG: hypothetical protein KAR42_11075 [candidate division Zixibacteria bacterium]|nr:hypothetical protein [candidate division Zixibacteria bacterium]